MTPFTALYDACVLYPAPLRDLLMHLALMDLFQARWTDDIDDEWIRNVLQKRPDLTREQLERTRSLMNENAPDCLVRGYEHLIETLTLPDPNDRHVLAAAIQSGASVIVTYNLAGFPEEYLATFDIEAQHPDQFVTRLIDLSPGRVCEAVRRQRQSLKNPPKTPDEFLDTLAKQQLPETVSRLTEFKDLI